MLRHTSSSSWRRGRTFNAHVADTVEIRRRVTCAHCYPSLAASSAPHLPRHSDYVAAQTRLVGDHHHCLSMEDSPELRAVLQVRSTCS